MIFAVSVCHEVESRLLNLNAAAAGVAKSEKFLIHCLCHVPDDFALVFIFGRVNIEEERHNLRAAGAKFDGLTGLGLRKSPKLWVVEGPVLNFFDFMRPAPTRVNLAVRGRRRLVEP